MAEHECRPEDGYGGIAAALERAVPDDTVRLIPGVYKGTETLRHRRGVTLSGNDARLVHSGAGPAIEARGVANVAIEGVAIEVVPTDVPLKREPDDPPIEGETEKVEWGVLWLDGVAHGRIANVSVAGATTTQGICVRGGKGTRVLNCVIEGGQRSGLVLLNARADQIRNNRCHGNAHNGIVLGSSHAAEIAANECWDNQLSGIVLTRAPNSPEAPSEATLRGNRCHGNAQAGITLSLPPTPRRSRRTSARRIRLRVSCSIEASTTLRCFRRPRRRGIVATATASSESISIAQK